MKFLTQALVAAMMAFSSVEARRSFNKHDFDQKVAAGQYDKTKLLRNAVPYKGEGSLRRRAEQQAEDGNANNEGNNNANNGNDDYQRVEVTSNFKVQFNSCLTMETENYNLLLNNLASYAESGDLVSIRNYVLFDVCDGDDCEAQTWMVDLVTFIEAVIDYGPNRKSVICQACQNYGQDVCGETYYYNGNGNNNNNGEQEQDQQDGNNGGRRFLDGGYNIEYELFDENMCNECQDYGCGYDGEGDQQFDFESIEAWIYEIAQCKQNEVTWNNLNTYSGWMCNADGSGIEIGVFLDQYCRMYTRSVAYSSVIDEQDYQYFFQSQDIIPSMFTDIIECRDLTYVQYVDEDTYQSLQENGDYYYDQGYGNVADACQLLFYGDFVPRSISYCGEARNWTDAELAQQQANMAASYQQSGSYQYGEGQQQQQQGGNGNYNQNGNSANNNYNQNGNMYGANGYYNQNANGNNNGNANGQNQNNGQTMYQYIQSQSMMYNNYGQDTSWYTYDIGASEILDPATVCEKVGEKWAGAGYSTGNSAAQDAADGFSGIENVYDAEDDSNSFWKWSNGKKSSNSNAQDQDDNGWLFPTRNNHSSLQTASTRLSPMEIAWIVIASIGVTALFMHYTRKQVLKRRAKKQQEKEVYYKTNDKGQPLIIS